MNQFYNATGYPQNSQDGDSGSARAELLAIQSAFDKLPPLSGHPLELVQINAGGTGMGSMSFAIGTWIPTFSFVTPGDLALVYGVRDGYFVRIGPLVLVGMRIDLSTFTWTTASGNAQITGLPYPPTSINNAVATGAAWCGGITKAAATQIEFLITPFNGIQIVGRGSGVSAGPIVAADMPSGGVPTFQGSIVYRTDAA